MTTTARQHRPLELPSGPVAKGLDRRPEQWDEWSATIPHDCEADAASQDRAEARAGRRRLLGIDAARGVALLGMFAVHVVSPADADGNMSTAWTLAAGKSSALFAVLAGIGLAFLSRPSELVRASRWWRTALTPLVRGILIALLGLALGLVIPVESAQVILPYLGVMFLLSLPLLTLGPRALLSLAVCWAVLGPVASHLLRAGRTDTAQPPNLTLELLLSNPGDVVSALLLTGYYPAATWMAYLCLGMGLGRLDLTRRRVALWLVVAGTVTVAVTLMVSRLLLGRLAGLQHLADDVMPVMPLEDFTDVLVWGGEGTAPTTSWWWLASAAPHTGTPTDLAYTGGIALLVLGCALGLAHAFPGLIAMLARPGSMTLTLYTTHLLLLMSPLAALPEGAHLAAQVVLALAFAVWWGRSFSRGPLEWLVWRVASALNPQPARHAGRALPRPG